MTIVGLATLLLAIGGTQTGCENSEPLDAATAERIIRSRMFERQPAYAEVPRVVRWGPGSPRDEFDELSLLTLDKLHEAGLVTTSRTVEPDGTVTVTAETTADGFRELGTVPSARGPALRGRIAERVIDEVRGFQRHPSQPHVGRAEVHWHYENPTDLYPLFETRRDKPLGKPFRTIVSVSHSDRGWIVETIVPKERIE